MSRPLVLVLLVILLAACGGAPANTPTSSPTGGTPTTPAPTATASGVAYAGSEWSSTALGVADQLGERFTYHCPAGGSAGVVWGTDTYTVDSSVCTAAVHAGLVSLAVGGDVVIEVRPGETAYTGSERNGVSTLSYGSYGTSFIFVDALAATPSPGATAGGAGFGANTLLFEDDFSADDMGWQTGTESWGSVSIADDVLALELTQASFMASLVGPVDTRAWDVLRVEATWTRQVGGTSNEYVGLFCGDDGATVGAALGTNGWRVFIGLGDPNAEILGLQTDGPPFTLDGPVRLVVECAGTNTGSLRLQVWLDDVLLASHVGDDGPASFNRVGAYFEGGAGSAATVDDVAVYGGTAAGLPPPATASPTAGTSQPTGALTLAELLTHIPPSVGDCGELVHTFPGTSYGGASVSAQCVPAASMLGPDTETATVRYHWYDHFSKADQYFGDQLERLGDQFGEDCGAGPSHYLQQADGELIGRVICAGDPAQGQRIEAFWGDSRLNVIGWITIEPGSYPDLGDLLDAAQLVP